MTWRKTALSQTSQRESSWRGAPTQRAAAVARVGVRTLVLASLSAPRSSSSRTHSKWPENAAVCSGVAPFCARPHTANKNATHQRRSVAHTTR